MLVRALFASLVRTELVVFIDTRVELRKSYHYFTVAPMGRLRAAGFARTPTSLEAGVRQYIARLS